MTDLDRQADLSFTPFALTVEDLYCYWQGTIEHAYRVLKGKRRAELKGQHWRGWNGEGLHDLSAAVGRLQAIEMLLPELRDLWHVGRHGELTTVKVIDQHAREDAEYEFRNEVLLGALATGEVLAPESEAA